MQALARRVAIRMMMPHAWRHDPRRAAVALKRFGDTEADSAWQYFQAIGMTQDAGLQSMLLRNVLEELRHAELFYTTAHEVAQARLQSPPAERMRLVDSPSGMAYFLAYVQESERVVHGEFEAYAAACSLPTVSQVFGRIAADEERHESEAGYFLDERAASPRHGRWLRVRARMQRQYESLVRASRRAGGHVFGAILTLVYLTYGALLGAFSPRPGRTGP